MNARWGFEKMRCVNAVKQEKPAGPAPDPPAAGPAAVLKYSGSSKMIFSFGLDQDRRNEWLEFWQRAKHSHAQQHYDHAAIESARGRRPIYIAGIDKKNITLAGIFSIRPLLGDKKYSLEAVCLRGPVFDDINAFEEFLPRIVSQFKKLGVGSIRISPYWKYPEAARLESLLKTKGFRPYYKKEGPGYSTGYIDLRPPVEEMFKLLSKSAGQSVRRIDSLGIEFRQPAQLSDAMAALRSFNNMRRSHGLSPMSGGRIRGRLREYLKEARHGPFNLRI